MQRRNSQEAQLKSESTGVSIGRAVQPFAMRDHSQQSSVGHAGGCSAASAAIHLYIAYGRLSFRSRSLEDRRKPRRRAWGRRAEKRHILGRVGGVGEGVTSSLEREVECGPSRPVPSRLGPQPAARALEPEDGAPGHGREFGQAVRPAELLVALSLTSLTGVGHGRYRCRRRHRRRRRRRCMASLAPPPLHPYPPRGLVSLRDDAMFATARAVTRFYYR